MPSQPQDVEKGVVYTEGNEPQNDATAYAVGPSSDPIKESYTAVIQTRPYRFEDDGWDFTKSQTTATRNR